MLLKNKVSIITGCNKGIGNQILKTFSENGSVVFACVRDLNASFKAHIDEIQKITKSEIIPIQIDLSKDDQIKKAADEILSFNKPIDVLINNAGIIHTALFQMTSGKKLREIFEVNFFSQSKFTQYISKSMIKNKKGNIIYISSTSGIDSNEGRSAYSSSKAAMISESKSLSRELGHYNIRVNCIAPGLTKTDMMSDNTPEKIITQVRNNVSLKRIAEPNEVANATLFLASDLASYITGQILRVDGGM